MAKYFKFKNAEQLLAEANRLGAPIRLTADCGPLALPALVGGRKVGNRIAIQPMEGCDAKPDGTPDELTYRRFARFGAGGAKLIWGEATAVVLDGQANARQLHIHERNIGAFAQAVELCRQAHRQSIGDDSDLLIGLQLTHSGRFSFRKPVLAVHCPVLDPRTIVDKSSGATAESPYPLITDDQLQGLADHYVTAAKRACAAGFDFVDVKQCHRYLLSELLAAKTRPGKFGGSLENRTRFALEVVGRIRSEVPGLIIGTRLNVFDGIPYRTGADGIGEPCSFTAPYRTGFGAAESDPLKVDLSEPIEYIGKLRDAGVALVNVSMGCPYFNPHVIRPTEYPPTDGYEAPEHPLLGVARHFQAAAQVQQRFPDLAIVGSGYSYLQEFLFEAAAANVGAAQTTFIGLGRASLAYPDSPRDVLAGGTLNRKSVCRTFSYCTNLMRSKHNALGQFATGCPPFDKDGYQELWKECQSTAPSR